MTNPRLLLKSMIERVSDPWMDRQPAWLGDENQVVLTSVPGVYNARLINAKVVKVLNRVHVSADYDIPVIIGRHKDMPTTWQIIEARQAYLEEVTGGRIEYHHLQHEEEGPDRVDLDIKQTLQYTVRVYDSANFIVKVGGRVFSNGTGGLVQLNTQLYDISAYVGLKSATYLTIEVDDTGVLSANSSGVDFGSPLVANIAYVPSPDPGKHTVAYILMSEAYTALLDAHIRVPTPIALNPGIYLTEVNWGDIGGMLSDQTDLQAVLDAKMAADADYSVISANDASTNITGSELEELSDGSETTLHSHAGSGGAVDSVNGQTGVVVLDAADIANTPAGNISASDVQAAINELDTEKSDIGHSHGTILTFDDGEGDPNDDSPSTANDGISTHPARRDHVHIFRVEDAISAAGSDTPIDADYLGWRKTTGAILKKINFSGLKTFLKSYFDGIYAAIGANPGDGWIADADTWTRTGNHTYTKAGDHTATHRKSARVRYKDGGGYEYGVIGSSSVAGGTTTINLIPNSDYAMAAATITDTYISYVENPEGFPISFNYTPTHGGFSTAPSGGIYIWTPMAPGTLKIDIREVNNGVSNATTFTISVPIVAKTLTNMQWTGFASAVDNGALLTAPAWCRILSAATVIELFTLWNGSGWTAGSTNKRAGSLILIYEY